MNVLATQYSLADKALEIYLAGCRGPHCPGCHNPESWEFGAGVPLTAALPAILRKSRLPMVECIWVLGGEPLDQPLDELCGLLDMLNQVSQKPIVLFTRHALSEIPSCVLQKIAAVKTGRYDEGAPKKTCCAFGVVLSSEDQAFYPNDHPAFRRAVEAAQ